MINHKSRLRRCVVIKSAAVFENVLSQTAGENIKNELPPSVMLKRDELMAVTGNLPACYVWSSS